MTTSSPTVPDIPAPLAPARPPARSVTALISFILAAVTAFLYMTAKTLVPILETPQVVEKADVTITVMGALGLASIVLIAAVIALGHVGLVSTKRGARGRWLAVAGVAIGYLFLALYLNRILISIIALVSYPHQNDFVQNNFVWA